MHRIIVFISGSGGNLQALINATKHGELAGESVGGSACEIALVVSNRKAAYGLIRAEEAGIPTLYVPLKPYSDAGRPRDDYDADLADQVNRCHADLIVLAGWMHIFTPVFFERIAARVINLHPALPGQFPGAHGIQDQFDAYQRGEISEGGCMVHDAIPELDAGPVIGQAVVPFLPGDTIETFSERLHAAEHKLLVECVARVLAELPASL